MRRLSLVVVVLVVTGLVAPVDAQRRRGVDPNRPLPVATNTLRADVEPYLARTVLVSAAVQEILSPTAFVVDQRRVVDGVVRPLGEPVLVLAPYLVGVIDLDQYLLMQGSVRVFDPATATAELADYTLDLSLEQVAAWEGAVMLLVTSVIDPTHQELARIPPTPTASADEAASAQ
jgi:hypothetical protein